METTTTEMMNADRSAGKDDLLQLVSFVVGAEEFAVPILSVHEINRMMEITRVPQSPPFVEGVINLRGKIIPVVDLRKRFGMMGSEQTSEHRIVVVEVAKRVVGFTVDRVNEVLRIPTSIVEPPPPMISSIDSEYVKAVGKLDDRLLILLDLQKLFERSALKELDAMAA